MNTFARRCIFLFLTHPSWILCGISQAHTSVNSETDLSLHFVCQECKPVQLAEVFISTFIGGWIFLCSTFSIDCI